MADKKKVRGEIADLEAQEKETLEALATSIANLEHLDEDLEEIRDERDLLKRRKGKGLTYDQDKLRQLNDEVRDRREQVAKVRQRLTKRKGRVRAIRNRIKRRRRQLRNLNKPRIIDLDLTFRPMEVQGPVVRVIGHYTAGPRDESTEDAIRLCRIYHQAHLNQGWSGEAYMCCFTVDGDILLLRPARFVGAHTLGYNTGSYGVMCHGTTGDRPNAAQKRAMRWWAKNGHKNLMGKGQTQKAPESYPWFGHNEFNPTGCPGSFIDAYHSQGKSG